MLRYTTRLAVGLRTNAGANAPSALSVAGPSRALGTTPAAASGHRLAAGLRIARVNTPSALSAAGPSRALSTTSAAASGHSRWSKIRHAKGAVDAARCGVFSRLMGVSVSGGRERIGERGGSGGGGALSTQGPTVDLGVNSLTSASVVVRMRSRSATK
jgi:hypothetical protein